MPEFLALKTGGDDSCEDDDGDTGSEDVDGHVDLDEYRYMNTCACVYIRLHALLSKHVYVCM